MTFIKSVTRTIRLRYSYARLNWLCVTIAGLAILTFSASELWIDNSNSLYNHISSNVFYPYVAFFISLIFFVNLLDYYKICNSQIVSTICSIFSLVFDLTILFSAQLLILLTINQIDANLLISVRCIILLILPFSLGGLTISSLTVEYLQNRTEKLRKDLSELKKRAESLSEGRAEDKKKIEILNEAIEKLKNSFNKEDNSGE